MHYMNKYLLLSVFSLIPLKQQTRLPIFRNVPLALSLKLLSFPMFYTALSQQAGASTLVRYEWIHRWACCSGM